MGLINFLKEKFFHRKDKNKEEEKKTEETPKPEEVKPAEPVVESKSEEPAKPVEAPKPEEVKPAEPVVEPKPEEPAKAVESPKPEEVKPAEPIVEPKPAEPAKPVEAPKPEEVKPAEPIVEPKPEEPAKPVEAPKPEEVKPEQPKPENKPAATKLAPEKKPEPKPEPVKKEAVRANDIKVEAAHVETEKEIEDKYVAGLDKSRIGFTEKLKKLAKSNKVVNQEYFDNLERILIEADVGVNLSLELIKETSMEASANKITDPNELNDLLIDKMFISYANKGGSFQTEIHFAKEGPTVVFMCGVNGVGKTTTVAKLAYRYKAKGMKVLLVAGDTFRAGAVEQLVFWAGKVGVDIISRPNSDPASLCYDAMKKAKDEHYDLVIVDTAGRLQNKKGLMDELSKMVRVIKKIIPEAPHESLLILDANTGQNGIDQASVFKEAVQISGIVITKMDGTSKGGIILSIRDRLALPVKFIGLGEKMLDLEEFDLDKYLYGLLIGDQED